MRHKKDCVMKRLYDMATPYVQIIGWAVVAVPILYGSAVYLHTTLAYGDDITSLKAWREQTEPSMAAMKQEIDDIHEVVVRHGR